ncbi:MAG: cytochrome-c peroxidase [Bacteroidia bacterium]
MSTSNQYLPEDAPMFWDSPVKSLEKQALEPILALEEMRETNFSKEEILVEVVNRLKGIPKYASLFQAAFPEPDPINADNIGKSIATFERLNNCQCGLINI